MDNGQLKTITATISIILGLFMAPSYWLGQYQSDLKNNEEKERLKKIIEDQAENTPKLLREQRIELKEEREQDIKRYMLICTSAARESKEASASSAKATESAKNVLETVEENRNAQVESIIDTLKEDVTPKKKGK